MRHSETGRERSLLTADWHLTDRPQDEYRWGVIDAVIDAAAEHECARLVLLGDIIDRKDRLPASFVERLRDGLCRLLPKFHCIWWLTGNHDYSEFGHSYLSLVLPGAGHTPHLAGVWPAVDAVCEVGAPGGGCDLLVPHGAWPEEGLPEVDGLVFAHELVLGATGPGGRELPGREYLAGDERRLVFAGDVHIPQEIKVGNSRWVYVGAPHPINFGDPGPFGFTVLDYEPDPKDADARHWRIDRHRRVSYWRHDREDAYRKEHVVLSLKNVMRAKDVTRLLPKGLADSPGAVRIELECPVDDVDSLPLAARKLEDALAGRAVGLDSVVESVATGGADGAAAESLAGMSARELFDEFCGREEVGERLRGYGGRLMAGRVE